VGEGKPKENEKIGRKGVCLKQKENERLTMNEEPRQTYFWGGGLSPSKRNSLTGTGVEITIRHFSVETSLYPTSVEDPTVEKEETTWVVNFPGKLVKQAAHEYKGKTR